MKSWVIGKIRKKLCEINYILSDVTGMLVILICLFAVSIYSQQLSVFYNVMRKTLWDRPSSLPTN